MKRNRFNIMLIVLLTLSCSMEPEDFDERPHYQNNSKAPIIHWHQYNYPDTAIGDYSPLRSKSSNTINPGEKHFDRVCCWDAQYERNPLGVVMFFIYDLETLETTPWDSVRENYMVLRRYDLTLDSLKKLDWTITYP